MTTTTPCEHHYCTRECLYGPANQIVASQIQEPEPGRLYQGVLCCKCHRLVVDREPLPQAEECRERWREYNRRVGEYIRRHGPLGG